jgi:hypothetical protein
MSAADERLAELLDRWLTSVEQHARYLALDDASYARVQDWPKHERPNRWVVELASTRLKELRELLAERTARGDTGFAEGLELMAFLTTLLGSEHLERFIPLAQPPPRDVASQAAAGTGARPTQASGPVAAPPGRSPTDTGVRRDAPRRQATTQLAPAGSRTREPEPARRPASTRPSSLPPTLDKASATVVADAVRLLNWGREWPQLAGLIARLADRPSEPDIWKILRHHRATIEAQARRRID